MNSEVNIEKIDILLVDDRLENLLALESVLESPNYNLIKVTSGQEALRYLLDHEPALILMDIQMPEMDGYETTTLIKKNIRTRDIPIIFVTAINQDERHIRQGYDRGAVDYIYKPYDAYILKAKVSVFTELALKTKRLIEYEKQILENERKEREQQIIRLELKSLKRYQGEQQKYLDLVQGISHGIVWSADADSLVMSFVSPSAEAILGYPLDQWSDDQDFFMQHVHSDDRKKIQEAIQKVKLEKKNLELDHRFIRKDGQEAWFHTGLRVSPKSDAPGFEVRGLSVEITKTKEAEEILRLNKKHSDFLATASLLLSESLDFNSTLPHITKLIVPTIADWCIIHLKNEDESFAPLVVTHYEEEQVEKMKGILSHFQPSAWTKPTLYSTNPSEFLSHLTQDPSQMKTLQSFGLKSAMVIPLVSHGKVFGLITFLNGDSKYFFHPNDFMMAQDLSRRIMMAFTNAKFYEQAQNAIQVRDEFLSVASHELKTPLTPLKLQIQMLLRMIASQKMEDLKPEKIGKLLQTSERQLGRLTLLIDELLDIARINSGKLQMNLEEFDLIELIHDILDRFAGQLTNAKCDLKLDLPENLTVHWDRFRMEQVIVNLLTNALKYGHSKPIRIKAELKSGKVEIQVEDQGIGIAKKDQERIFGRFERAVSGNNFAGLGLGLYIVTQLIEAHLGKISVDSELGLGSTFTLSLPQLVDIHHTSIKPAEHFSSEASS